MFQKPYAHWDFLLFLRRVPFQFLKILEYREYSKGLIKCFHQKKV